MTGVQFIDQRFNKSHNCELDHHRECHIDCHIECHVHCYKTHNSCHKTCHMSCHKKCGEHVTNIKNIQKDNHDILNTVNSVIN